KEEDLGQLRDEIRDAIATDQPFVEFGGEKIPASAEAKDSLAKLMGLVRPASADPPSEEQKKEPEPDPRLKHVLILDENCEELGFRRKTTSRSGVASGVPAAVRANLKQRQRAGLGWLQDTWARGYPGGLLADDMGLGKTLQALSFMAWLRDIAAAAGQFGD